MLRDRGTAVTAMWTVAVNGYAVYMRYIRNIRNRIQNGLFRAYFGCCACVALVALTFCPRHIRNGLTCNVALVADVALIYVA
ncbi:hypothetical protein LAUMK41_05903 [Mycobacterium attenuatum]|nr:hypothetical protein LAUMK41_05903 [Mycobacterium attenuatum]